MKRPATALLAALVLVLALAGCGSSATTPRNEADWAEAQQWAREFVAPEEALLGVVKSREREAELAKARYNTLVAQER